MKSILNEADRNEIIARIHALHEGSQAQWGKMKVHQMLRHCLLFDEMAQSRKLYKQSFIGKIFGKIALKGMIGDDRPLKANMPTVRGFAVNDLGGDVIGYRDQWIESMRAYARLTEPGFLHPFFGPLTKEQAGPLIYKHADHHLRQFGV